MSGNNDPPCEPPPSDGDNERESELQIRIEATVERALAKDLNPVVTTLQEALKAAAGGSVGKCKRKNSPKRDDELPWGAHLYKELVLSTA